MTSLVLLLVIRRPCRKKRNVRVDVVLVVFVAVRRLLNTKVNWKICNATGIFKYVAFGYSFLDSFKF